jgi:hypothetical protein
MADGHLCHSQINGHLLFATPSGHLRNVCGGCFCPGNVQPNSFSMTFDQIEMAKCFYPFGPGIFGHIIGDDFFTTSVIVPRISSFFYNLSIPSFSEYIAAISTGQCPQNVGPGRTNRLSVSIACNANPLGWVASATLSADQFPLDPVFRLFNGSSGFNCEGGTCPNDLQNFAWTAAGQPYVFGRGGFVTITPNF